jgi:hypothetical protein
VPPQPTAQTNAKIVNRLIMVGIIVDLARRASKKGDVCGMRRIL